MSEREKGVVAGVGCNNNTDLFLEVGSVFFDLNGFKLADFADNLGCVRQLGHVLRLQVDILWG